MTPSPDPDIAENTWSGLRRHERGMFAIVSTVLLGVGLVGGAVLLGQVRRQLYAQQSQSERRNAEAMARLLTRDLQAGLTEAAVIARLQAATEGMAQESDFLCLLDRDGRLLSHPNPTMVGRSKAPMAVAPLEGAGSRSSYGAILRAGRAAAGLVTAPAGDAAQLVYFHPVPGTTWMVTAHENAQAVAAQIQRLGWQLAAILVPTVALMALAGAAVARTLGRRHHRQIAAANAALERRVAERTRALSAALAELRTAHEVLVRGEKMHLLGELMSGIAHEISNPITVIQGYADLLAGEKFDPAVRGHAARLKAGASRVRAIVETLLDFARNRPPSRRPVALADLVARVEALIGSELRHARVAFATDLPPDLPEIAVDPQQLEQVLLNLLNNARQALAGHQGERCIALRVAFRGDIVTIEVADTGPGLAPEVRARLFQPFVTTKTAGNGIGLSLCRRFVEAHGGSIDAPETTLGCVFRIRLPIRPVVGAEEPEPLALAAAGAG